MNMHLRDTADDALHNGNKVGKPFREASSAIDAVLALYIVTEGNEALILLLL